MTQTRNKPIPPFGPPHLQDGPVEWIDPIQPDPDPGPSLFAGVVSLIAVLITMLGVLGGALLLGWSLVQLADLLGLLSS